MKNAKMTICLMTAVLVMAVTNVASADTIRGIGMDFVTIGNAGNPADGTVIHDGTIGYGAVGYEYRIGKYEITNAQWNAFTTIAGAPTGNDNLYTGGALVRPYDASPYYTGDQQPTNNVSYYEAAQFCNYLTSSNKSKGVYQFSGTNANPGYLLGIDRDAAKSIYGTIYFLPTDEEWYKAAYYKPDGSGYSLYANGTDTAPFAGVAANYDYAIGQPWDVGTGTMEQNGTFDMMGNVWEWRDWSGLVFQSGSGGYIRGGSSELDVSHFQSSCSGAFMVNAFEEPSIGFRVASVPEPATLLLLGLGAVMFRKFRA